MNDVERLLRDLITVSEDISDMLHEKEFDQALDLSEADEDEWLAFTAAIMAAREKLGLKEGEKARG